MGMLFHRLRSKHKTRSKSSDLKVYQYIRENGGWESFKLVVIEEHECESIVEVRAHESRLIKSLGSSLNIYMPGRTKNEQMMEYRENNQEQIKAYGKEYYFHNKEKLQTKYTCDCGGKYTHTHKAKHMKTMKHMEFKTNS